MLITAAPQSLSYNAASTEASASSQRDTSETLTQKEKQKQEKADKKLKQLIRETLPKPKRNSSARTPDPKQRVKEKSVPNTDRQPKGSDDPIRQHNRFSTLDMMKVEVSIMYSKGNYFAPTYFLRIDRTILLNVSLHNNKLCRTE